MSGRPPRIAIVGAGGFVGTRLIERWHLTGFADVVPIVRRPASLARLARFPLEGRLADAANAAELARAFDGCDAVVHTVVGDPALIVATAAALAQAAAAARIGRVIYLSSAMVHGPAPAHDYDEDAPLAPRQSFAYGRAKIAAEQRLAAAALPALIRLRPGVVYGPRSRWIADPASQLLRGALPVLDAGRGLCPAIYIDNLIAAIEAALRATDVNAGAFLVRDTETVTWGEFNAALAAALGHDASVIVAGLGTEPSSGWRHRLENVRVHPSTQRALARIPTRWKEAVKGALAGWSGRSTFAGFAPLAAPAPTRQLSAELTALQRNHSRMLDARARSVLGYAPPVSFAEGIVRSARWVEFARGDAPRGPA